MSTTRRGTEEDFVALPEGRCRFRLDGPENGRRMLLVHGATVPHWQFDALVPHLAAAGCRILRYDLPGHGESDLARGPCTLDRLAGQAEALLAQLGWHGPLVLLGHSLGGAVAAALAPRLAGRVEALVLSAPLLDAAASGAPVRLLRLPVVGELWMRLVGLRALDARRRRRFLAIGRTDLVGRYRDQASRPAFAKALISLARHGALGPHPERYALAGRHVTRSLVLWGDADHVIPRAHVDRVRELLGNASLEVLEGREHNLLFTAPERIAARVIAFLDTTDRTNR